MVVFLQYCCIRANKVIIGQGGLIRKKCFYSGISFCIRTKVVVFGQKWLNSVKK